MLCELIVYIVSVGHVWKGMFMLPVICDNTNSLYSLIFSDILGYSWMDSL